MSLFDLIFIAAALTTVITLIMTAIAAATGHRDLATRRFRRLGIGLGVYACVVVTTSIAVPRHTQARNEPLCFDDWCIGVDSVSEASSASSTAYTVRFQLLSRALRVTQRERSLAVYLTDSAGRQFPPALGPPSPASPPFDVALTPGESIVTTRRFELPANDRAVGVVVVHEGFPIDWFIIGQGPFRAAPLIRLDARP